MVKAKFTFYGGNAEFAKYKGPEAIVHGPAETGKSLSSLFKLHLCALKYKDANIVIVRKIQRDTYNTILETYQEKILGNDPGAWKVEPYGGQKPEWFDYKQTNARVWVAGMDKPGKVLSSERDIIYVNQAEELTLEDWETLTTRTTGRAGHMPYNQTIGDANPTWPTHWMYRREGLRLFESKHVDNPVLYQDGELTEQGERTMAVLQRLTGVRKQRLLYGVPAQAEGAIYTEYDDTHHRRYRDEAPDQFRRYIAGLDWGYRNPGALLVFGLTGDGVMWLEVQWYKTGKRIDWWVERAQQADEEFGIEAFVCDPSEPAYIDALKSAGLNAAKGFNDVRPGIDAVKRRLAEDGLFFVRDSLREPDQTLIENKRPQRVEDEIPSYVWKDGQKEKPIKEDDHGLDAMRYPVAYVDGLGRDTKKKIKIWRS